MKESRVRAPANSVISAELFPARIYTLARTHTRIYMFIKAWRTPSNSIRLCVHGFQQAVRDRVEVVERVA